MDTKNNHGFIQPNYLGFLCLWSCQSIHLTISITNPLIFSMPNARNSLFSTLLLNGFFWRGFRLFLHSLSMMLINHFHLYAWNKLNIFAKCQYSSDDSADSVDSAALIINTIGAFIFNLIKSVNIITQVNLNCEDD